MSLLANELPVFLEVEGQDPTFVIIDAFDFKKSKQIIKEQIHYKVIDLDLFCYHDGLKIVLWNEELFRSALQFFQMNRIPIHLKACGVGKSGMSPLSDEIAKLEIGASSGKARKSNSPGSYVFTKPFSPLECEILLIIGSALRTNGNNITLNNIDKYLVDDGKSLEAIFGNRDRIEIVKKAQELQQKKTNVK